MGHRHYASELGRFISRDPIGFVGGLNLYGAFTSPVTFTDPSGLDPQITTPLRLPSRIVPGLTPTVGLIITGRGFSNCYGGHAGLYIEGEGVYSLNGGSGGIGFNEGVTLEQYLQANDYRGARVYRIDNLSESQVNRLKVSLRNYDAECDTMDELGQYCSGLTCGGVLDYYLEAVGALPPIQCNHETLSRFVIRSLEKNWGNRTGRFKCYSGNLCTTPTRVATKNMAWQSQVRKFLPLG
jgi:hypothetical protein